MKELFTALALAQAEMEAATKDSNNPFFKSKYADLNSVMGAVKPALAKHGLAFVQVCHDAENAAKIETVIIHSSGEQFKCGAVSVPVGKHDAQGYGSALTYARRYSLAAAFGVGAEDDDGNAAVKSTSNNKKSSGPVAGVKITPATLAIEQVAKAPQDVQDALESHAMEIRLMMGKGKVKDAAVYCNELNGTLEPEEYIVMWNKLESGQRAAIIKAQDAMRVAA